MKKIGFVILLGLSHLAFGAPPEVLTNALDKYIEEGYQDFLPNLLIGSALENERAVLSQANMFAQVEAMYGNASTWEMLAECKLNDRMATFYWVIYFEKGPLYGVIDSYLAPNGTFIIPRFLTHTEASLIFPYFPISQDEICNN